MFVKIVNRCAIVAGEFIGLHLFSQISYFNFVLFLIVVCMKWFCRSFCPDEKLSNVCIEFSVIVRFVRTVFNCNFVRSKLLRIHCITKGNIKDVMRRR